MKLKLTLNASEKLRELNKGKYHYLVLWYDIEGCGCGVNGVNRIIFSNDVKDTYRKVDSSSTEFSIWVPEQQAIFFSEELALDFKNSMFRLSSAGEILNAFISPRSLFHE
ncbi:iron-sulfur cluster biosynthesis family protein [Virgibacillus halophilus]|uniref:Iron-sulfur cluster biosynthesis family protein n=1 Tax=Tigheibacillus halophilus TaxID=361280 RepID=A0ABU5CB07_9BACI|nr:iron-sulfur cluster biosynthesis family protein [Virgibacillus halophilus]